MGYLITDPLLGPILVILIVIGFVAGWAVLWAIVIPCIWWLLTGQVVADVGRYRRIRYRVIRKGTPPWKRLLDKAMAEGRRSIFSSGTIRVPRIESKNTRSIMLYLIVVVATFLSVSYACGIPSAPVVITNTRTYATPISYGVVVVRDVFVVRAKLTTTVATSVIIRGDNDYEITTHLTFYGTFTENYQTTTTSWSRYSITTTDTVQTTKHQVLIQTYPILWLIIPTVAVAAIVMVSRKLQ